MKKTNYRYFILLWASQSVSQMGSSMTGFALIIWAFKQTESAMAVSLLTFFSYLPYIIVSLFAGSFVDSHKKKSIMLCSDFIAFLCSILIILLLVTGRLQIWHIYVINSITGFMNSFQSPASSVALGIIVHKDKLANASGMTSFSSSLLTVITPMLASFISSFWGLKGVIIIDIFTFVFAFFILLIFIKIPEKIVKESIYKKSALKGCKEGFAYLIQNKGVWYLILSMAFINFFSRLTYENILPAMLLARSGSNNNVVGIVSGMLGIGGIVGGLYVSLFKLPFKPVKVIYFGAALSFLAGDLLMGFGNNIWFWCIAGLFASIPIPFINVGYNIIFYNYISTEMQGRIFAVRNAVQYATIPIGILLGGFLADYIFEPFMQTDTALVLFFQKLVGTGAGSGMALMFFCTGILGSIVSIMCYHNHYIQKLNETL